MMSLVFDMQVPVSDSRVTYLCWVPVRMRALGAQGVTAASVSNGE